MLPNPGPFVARRRWSSLSSSFPGREGGCLGVWWCLPFRYRGWCRGPLVSAGRKEWFGAGFSRGGGDWICHEFIIRSTTPRERANAEMDGTGQTRPAGRLHLRALDWTGVLDCGLALNVAGKIACILLLVETDRQTSSAHHPSSLFLLSGCVCVCFSLSHGHSVKSQTHSTSA